MDCDIAICMYYTGIDPFTKQPVYLAKEFRDRTIQRALRLSHSGSAAEGSHRGEVAAGERLGPLPTVANPSKGEKPGERGLPNQGYRPGRKNGTPPGRGTQAKGRWVGSTTVAPQAPPPERQASPAAPTL
jgi:hypothetical protein